MYFSMDEIGYQNNEIIKAIDQESDRWKFIYNTARSYGFEGIHITPSLYNKFGLNLGNIPDYFQDFILTFHLGGGYIAPENRYEESNKNIETAFEIAIKHNMHDISIHPPNHELTEIEKGKSLEFLHKVMSKWLIISVQSGISLSLETHVAGEYFLFDGLKEFSEFIDIYPDLGVLIDISHNYYNPKYSEDDIIRLLWNKNIKGLHISDSLRNAEFEEGTHLAIGDGTIDFRKLMKHFNQIPNIFGALEIKTSNEGLYNSLKYLKTLK